MQSRVALVTGCGKLDGIGAATARLLAASGTSVVVSDAEIHGVRNPNEGPSSERVALTGGLEQLCEEIIAGGGVATALIADLAIDAAPAELVHKVVAKHGRLDIVVNNAAAPKGDYVRDIAEAPLSAWDHVMQINVRSQFLMCRAAVPIMREQVYGRIVNIASVAAKVGIPKQAAYCASKAAVVGLTKSVALDVAAHGITVNAVLPGRVQTSRTAASAREAGLDPDVFVRTVAAELPRQILTQPEEVAQAVLFLASETAAAVNGTVLAVDSAQFPVL